MVGDYVILEWQVHRHGCSIVLLESVSSSWWLGTHCSQGRCGNQLSCLWSAESTSKSASMTMDRAAPGYPFILSSFLIILALSVIILIDAMMRSVGGARSFSSMFGSIVMLVQCS